jgi:eukaryotic-like serine/threonine-protein kinase
MEFHVGQVFGDYTVTAILGAGGMGHVYKVENRLTQRSEAMKVLAAELATDVQIKRFEREMRVLGRLSHPNIAALHNAFHSEKQLILLMESIEGRTLENIQNNGRVPLETGVGYIRQVLLALQHAHQQGVVHRDVTPSNVIVTNDGDVKLTDFGLSKSYGDSLLTNCGEVLGALPYMAPEQLKGATQPDRRSDLYSAGAILYEHLTGQKPFGANRRLAAVITDSEPDPQPPTQLEPSLAPEWNAIILRALARDPSHRYQSAAEFLDAIAQMDRTATPELRLPNLHPTGIGIAIAAGVVLALVASPARSFFQPVAPIAAPSSRMHIDPPTFAVAAPPAVIVKPADMHPVVKKPSKERAVVAEVEKADSIIITRSAQPAVPLQQHAMQPVAETPSSAVPPTQQVAVQQPVSEPSAAGQDQAVPQPKKFWNKLNVFKKKRKTFAENQQ